MPKKKNKSTKNRKGTTVTTSALMLEAHLINCEESLLQDYKKPSISGHGLHKGTPRESFVKKFLKQHLGSDLKIGTGELIDCESKPGEERNQHDIVLYKPQFPRIDYGKKVRAFLSESVVATIEIKSSLDKDDIEQAIDAGIAAKN
jgi:hypothetical protein